MRARVNAIVWRRFAEWIGRHRSVDPEADNVLVCGEVLDPVDRVAVIVGQDVTQAAHVVAAHVRDIGL
jgi:hypothetical protein